MIKKPKFEYMKNVFKPHSLTPPPKQKNPQKKPILDRSPFYEDYSYSTAILRNPEVITEAAGKLTGIKLQNILFLSL